MRFQLKVMLILILAMTIPLILVGIGSAIYYRDVVKNNVWDDNLATAKAIALHTPTYMESAKLYLESLSDRQLVINATRDKNLSFLDETTRYAGITFISVNRSPVFDEVFITDLSGKVLSSYPNNTFAGDHYFDRDFINRSINSDIPVVSDAILSNDQKKPTVYISIPIDDITLHTLETGRGNSTVYGAIVGEVNLTNYGSSIFSTQVKNSQYIYLVNRTGHIMVHVDPEYMNTMKNYTSVPAVQQVIQGHEGVVEEYNPDENDMRLAAYSPIPEYGWGVVVALPVNVAYQPVMDTTKFLLLALALLGLLAILLAIYIGNYFSKPILDMSTGAVNIPKGDYRRYLPLRRDDEVGDLARSLDHMADTIKNDNNALIAERDRAEEEKSRAELYVDIMGHDINNLNQVAMANLEYLTGAGDISDVHKGLAEHAFTAISSSAGIIDNVRKIQRVSTGDIPLERIDLDHMIREAIQEAHRPPEKTVNIDYSPAPGMYVEAAEILKEAFSNLINNAVTHSGHQVEINVSSNAVYIEGKKYYEIAIADDGPGIPDDVKRRLFQRFQRGTTRAQGKGLGLYITRMLAERFGGMVWVEDRRAGDFTQGSRFVIRLPAATELH